MYLDKSDILFLWKAIDADIISFSARACSLSFFRVSFFYAFANSLLNSASVTPSIMPLYVSFVPIPWMLKS